MNIDDSDDESDDDSDDDSHSYGRFINADFQFIIHNSLEHRLSDCEDDWLSFHQTHFMAALFLNHIYMLDMRYA